MPRHVSTLYINSFIRGESGEYLIAAIRSEWIWPTRTTQTGLVLIDANSDWLQIIRA